MVQAVNYITTEGIAFFQDLSIGNVPPPKFMEFLAQLDLQYARFSMTEKLRAMVYARQNLEDAQHMYDMRLSTLCVLKQSGMNTTLAISGGPNEGMPSVARIFHDRDFAASFLAAKHDALYSSAK